MSNEELLRSVPLFDGFNYTIWAQAITAALRSKGVWQITRGHESRPVNLPTGSNVDDVAARVKEKADWDNRDDQALGLMQIKMQRSLHHHISDTTTSGDLWKNLKDIYG